MTKPNGTAGKAALGLACCLDAGLMKEREMSAAACQGRGFSPDFDAARSEATS